MVGSSAPVRPLFGGAITAFIPQQFVDVSNFRQVPDNQEVFSHAETDRSLIVELLEMDKSLPPQCRHPAEFHFSVLSRDAGAIEARMDNVVTVPPSEYPHLLAGDPNVSISIAHGMHLVTKFRDHKSTANKVAIYLACVRLPRATTDLLLVFNDPVMLHPDSASTRLGSSVADPQTSNLSTRSSVFRTALATLQIKDWSLLL